MSIATPVWIGFSGGVGIILLTCAGFAIRHAWLTYHGRELHRAFLKLTPWVARDLILPDGLGGRIHADYLILTPRALHWLNVFQVQGSIFGSHNMKDWTVLDFDKRWTFPNPLLSTPHKSGAIRALTGDSIPLVMDLLFPANPVFPKGRVDGIWLPLEYIEYLQSELNPGGEPPESWQNLWRKILASASSEPDQETVRA